MDSEGDEHSTIMQKPCLTIPALPPELITIILSRLPVKSLLHFRSVSKSWLALISSPQFIKTHIFLSANNKDNTHHRLLMLDHSLPAKLKNYSLSSVTETFDVDYFNSIEVPYIVGSANGLVCFLDDFDLLLWNPSTRKYKKVPDCLAMPRQYCIYWTRAFGYDEVHDDYKVVIIFFNGKGGDNFYGKVEIYSLKTDSWRTFDEFLCESLQLTRFVRAKFVNGKLYWVTICSFRGYKCGDIVFLDLTKEKWGKVEQPCYGEGDFTFKLEVLRSDLSMFCMYQTTHTDVWIMKEYGVKESWTKMCTINFPDDLEHDELSPPFFMSNKGEILLVFGSTLLIYNPKDDSVRDVKVGDPHCVSLEIYLESLVCPTLQNELVIQQ